MCNACSSELNLARVLFEVSINNRFVCLDSETLKCSQVTRVGMATNIFNFLDLPLIISPTVPPFMTFMFVLSRWNHMVPTRLKFHSQF